jgi:SAM-dependent methyltransferase
LGGRGLGAALFWLGQPLRQARAWLRLARLERRRLSQRAQQRLDETLRERIPALLELPERRRHAQAPAPLELEKVSRLLGVHHFLIQQLRPELRALHVARRGTVRVLDLSLGQGALLARIARFAAVRGIPLSCTGIVPDERTAVLARRCLSDAGVRGRVIATDIRNLSSFANGEFDLVLSSFLLHRLTPEEAATVLREVARLSTGSFLLLEARRSLAAIVPFYLLLRTYFSSATRQETLLALCRGHTLSEARGLLAAAELAGRATLAPCLVSCWYASCLCTAGSRR